MCFGRYSVKICVNLNLSLNVWVKFRLSLRLSVLTVRTNLFLTLFSLLSPRSDKNQSWPHALHKCLRRKTTTRQDALMSWPRWETLVLARQLIGAEHWDRKHFRYRWSIFCQFCYTPSRVTTNLITHSLSFTLTFNFLNFKIKIKWLRLTEDVSAKHAINFTIIEQSRHPVAQSKTWGSEFSQTRSAMIESSTVTSSHQFVNEISSWYCAPKYLPESTCKEAFVQ